jgi:hypothetical protein
MVEQDGYHPVQDPHGRDAHRGVPNRTGGFSISLEALRQFAGTDELCA